MPDKTYLDWPFFAPHHAALEAALDAGECLEPGAHRGEVDAEEEAHAHGGERVAHVVHARHAQGERA